MMKITLTVPSRMPRNAPARDLNQKVPDHSP